MRCEPVDKHHTIGGRRGSVDGPACDAVCDCAAVECKSSLGIDDDVVSQLEACLKLLTCDEKRAVLCFERMRMPGRYVREYYRARLGVEVEFHGRGSQLCRDADCF